MCKSHLELALQIAGTIDHSFAIGCVIITSKNTLLFTISILGYSVIASQG